MFALVVAGSLIIACSSEDAAPAMAGSHGTGGARSDGGAGTSFGGSGTTNNDVATGACTIGDSRSCRYLIGGYQNQESCFVGLQYCDTGTWTKCTEPRDAS